MKTELTPTQAPQGIPSPLAQGGSPALTPTQGTPALTPQSLRALILSAPTSGPYSEEARRDALLQLQDLEATLPSLAQATQGTPAQGGSPAVSPSSPSPAQGGSPALSSSLLSLLTFWQDDYRAAVIDDNFARYHRFTDALQPLLTRAPQDPRVLQLQADAQSAFQSTTAPSLFDPEEHYLHSAQSLLPLLSSQK